jgi:hypothetical protein
MLQYEIKFYSFLYTFADKFFPLKVIGNKIKNLRNWFPVVLFSFLAPVLVRHHRPVRQPSTAASSSPQTVTQLCSYVLRVYIDKKLVDRIQTVYNRVVARVDLVAVPDRDRDVVTKNRNFHHSFSLWPIPAIQTMRQLTTDSGVLR